MAVGSVARRGSEGRGGFTLVELLVVIGIIGTLVAILLPSLNFARRQAQSLKCLSNVRQLGAAFQMYTNDNHGWYPVHSNWGNCFGKKGTRQVYDSWNGFTGMASDTGIIGERPLNKYIDHPEVFECPSDMGDSYWAGNTDIGIIPNCFEAFGTSYLVQWEVNFFGVQHVTASGEKEGRYPLRVGTAGNMSKKIILGDWSWHPTRKLANGQTAWHGGKGQRQLNMLFGDGHAELFTFPREFESDEIPVDWNLDQAQAGTAPDPARGFW